MYMKISRSRDVELPIRANPGDALDFFIPNDFEETPLTTNNNILIPSGIKVEVPFGFGLLLVNKSGIASKKSIVIGSCLIDHGYSGEIHFDLHNIGYTKFTIKPGMKIVQGLLIPLSLPSIIEVDEDELYKDTALVSTRGSGGFGSTGVEIGNKKTLTIDVRNRIFYVGGVRAKTTWTIELVEELKKCRDADFSSEISLALVNELVQEFNLNEDEAREFLEQIIEVINDI